MFVAANCAFMPVAPAHVSAADARQTDIYRRMTPKQRVAVALGMHEQARALMDAGIRASHPHWSEAERRREIARRTLHARS